MLVSKKVFDFSANGVTVMFVCVWEKLESLEGFGGERGEEKVFFSWELGDRSGREGAPFHWTPFG